MIAEQRLARNRLCLARESLALSRNIKLYLKEEKDPKLQTRWDSRAAGKWKYGQLVNRMNIKFCVSFSGHRIHITRLHISLKSRNQENFSSFTGGHICYFFFNGTTIF